MPLRNQTTLLCGILLLASGLLCGCTPKVNYSPKVSSATKSKSRPITAATKSKDAGNELPSTATSRDPASALIAFDEFDGVHRAGWKEPGLGEWKDVGEERDGTFVVAGDVDVYRELANPVDNGVLWYAVTMRMETPVTGIASVDGSPGSPKRFGKLGFSAVDRPFTSRGFWMDTERDTKIENTELQTFLTRYSFEAKNSEGFAARDFGLALIDSDGMVFIRPRVKMDGNFAAARFSHLSLKKAGPEKLIIERVAIARTAEAALYPQLPAVARKPDFEEKPVTAEKPKPEPTEPKSEATPSPSAANEPKPAETPEQNPTTGGEAAKTEDNKKPE